MGLLGAIVGAVTGVVSAIAGGLGLGGKIAAALTIGKLAVEAIKKVGQIFHSIGQKLGIIPEDEELEETGEKALQMEEQGQGYDPEKESYKEYMERLKEFEADPKLQHSEEERIKAGTQVSASALIDEFPNCEDLLETVLKRGDDLDISDAELEHYIKSENSKDIASYLSGNEKNADIRVNVVKEIADIQKQLNPQMSDIDARKKAYSMEG